MKSLVLFFYIFTLCTFASVGFDKTSFENKQNNRVLKSYIWYPSNEKATNTYAQNIAFEGFEAKENSKIKEGKFPLVVLTHGTSGNWKNLSWLASKLAQKDYIVISSNHPGYTTGDANAKSIIKMWNQAKDVSFLIDSIFESKYKNSINRDLVFTIGTSLGGYTSLALSGAILDMRGFKEFCTKNSDVSCKYFKKAFSVLDEKFYKESSKSLKDERIKASVALVPGFVPMMTNESLKNITTPVLFVAAKYDKNVPIETHYNHKKEYFSKSIKYKEYDASHFSFLQICKIKAKLILEEEGAAFVCNDGKTKSRKEIHNILFDDVINLFESVKN